MMDWDEAMDRSDALVENGPLKSYVWHGHIAVLWVPCDVCDGTGRVRFVDQPVDEADRCTECVNGRVLVAHPDLNKYRHWYCAARGGEFFPYPEEECESHGYPDEGWRLVIPTAEPS